MNAQPERRPLPVQEEAGEISLADLVSLLWGGRRLILATALIALALGGYYAWRKAPVYQVNALLQIEDKKPNGGPDAIALQGLFDEPSIAQAEIEIIKSDLVLSRAIDQLHLDIVTQPKFNFLTGNALVRGKADAPRIAVDRFDLAENLKGEPFTLQAKGNDTFQVKDPDGNILGSGKVGEPFTATCEGQPLVLQVNRLQAKAGRKFRIVRAHMLDAIATLRDKLQVAERGKQTNVVGLSYQGGDPARAAEILNAVIGQYVKQNIDRKAEEASKSLAFLQEQLPQLHAQLDLASTRLNQYRSQSGSVDLTEESKVLLQQSADIQSQLVQLQQKRDDLLRTYKPGADVVTTLNQQIATLQGQADGVDGRIKRLPRTQQDIVAFSRDVQVNTDLYTAMLNNIQQLQVTKAGEIGNARIVDYARPAIKAVSPRVVLVLPAALALGLFLGIALLLARRALHPAIEDPRVIESRLGLPVLITIPHSEAQTKLHRHMEQEKGEPALLAVAEPEDLAVESLRSLRTSLHFTLLDAPDKLITLSGPSPHIGKSFVSANLGVILAQAGSRVLLVDADLRRGVLHHYFGETDRAPGLSDLLANLKSREQVTRATATPGLDLIPSGTLPPNPSELLMSARFSAFLQEVGEAYDHVILDAPPVLAVTDATVIARQTGTLLLLVRAGTHPLGEIEAALQRFEHAGTHPKGCIFNDVPQGPAGYGYQRYAYHYSYKSKASE